MKLKVFYINYRVGGVIDLVVLWRLGLFGELFVGSVGVFFYEKDYDFVVVIWAIGFIDFFYYIICM